MVHEVLHEADAAHEVLEPFHYMHTMHEDSSVADVHHIWNLNPATWAMNVTKYAEGYQWRFLSSRTPTSVSKSDVPCKPCESSEADDYDAACRAFDEEARRGLESFQALLKFISRSEGADLLDFSLKTVGNLLRDTKEKIERRDESIPEHIVKFGTEAVRLRKYLYEAADIDS